MCVCGSVSPRARVRRPRLKPGQRQGRPEAVWSSDPSPAVEPWPRGRSCWLLSSGRWVCWR
eukprot:4736157-Pyramimonas_sp.AAC.1